MAHTPDHLDSGASEARNEPPTRKFMANLRAPFAEPPARGQSSNAASQPTKGFGSLMLGGPVHQEMMRAERSGMRPGGDRAMSNEARDQIAKGSY